MTKYLPLLLVLAGPAGCIDATHDKAVDALGGEAPGVRPGPLHRPGQPCVTCHGGEGPGNSEFSLAGTVYLVSGQATPAPNVIVQLEDSTGVAGTIPTNDVGTFYVDANVWRPKYPVQVTVIYGTLDKQMQTVIGRAGSCADCHTDPPGMLSPGRVYVALSQMQLKNAKP